MKIENKRTGAVYQSDTLVKSPSGFFWDEKNQMGAINLLFTEDDGWEEVSSSLWVSVKERLPKENQEYLVVLDNRVICVARYNKNNKSWLIYGNGYSYCVVAYMRIPSFDQILEANKDVLQRMKEKGD